MGTVVAPYAPSSKHRGVDDTEALVGSTYPAVSAVDTQTSELMILTRSLVATLLVQIATVPLSKKPRDTPSAHCVLAMIHSMCCLQFTQYACAWGVSYAIEIPVRELVRDKSQ